MVSATAAYWILLIFGGFAVAVHAYQLFGTTLPSYRENTYSIISLTPVLSLGPPRGYLRGFIFYLAIMEVVFIILATSSTILKMTLQLQQDKDLVGALTLPEGTELDPAFPIAAAMVLITLSAIKPFSEIEQAFRRVSHRLAGIPRSFFDVVTKVRRFEYLPSDGRFGKSSEAGRDLAAQVEAEVRRSGLDESTASDISSAVALIYALEPWTLGREADRLWTQQGRHAFQSLIDVIKPKFDAFDLRLRKLLGTTGTAGNAEKERFASEWETIETTAEGLQSDLASIFALLYLSEPAIQPPKTSPILRGLISSIREEQQSPWINLFTGTLILGFLVNVALIYVVYTISTAVKKATSTEVVSVIQALPRILVDTLLNVVDYTIIFATAALIALLVRASRVEIGRWHSSHSRGFPFANYGQVALLSYVCTAVVFLATRFVVDVVIYPQVTSNSLWISPERVSAFGGNAMEYCTYAAAALPCAWYAVLVADKFDAWSHGRLLTAGLACSTIVGLISGAVHLLGRTSINLHALVLNIAVPALIVAAYFGCLAVLAKRLKEAEPAGEVQHA